ncbi:BEL1-like homeodomain protein 8, putative [Fagus crenata]
MMLKCVFNGSISMHDMEIERRPYHRNCSCALHKLVNVCSNYSQHRKISFRKKKSCSDCTLYIAASKCSSQSSLPGTSSNRKREEANGTLFTWTKGNNWVLDTTELGEKDMN